MRIIQLSDLPIEETYSKIKHGENIGRQHVLYGYDALVESGIEVIAIDTYKKTFLNRVINSVGFRLGITHLVLQLKCLKVANSVDLIYCHILQLTPLLSRLRKWGLLKTPVLAIVHDAFSERATSIKTLIGLDKVLFLGETTLDLALKKEKLLPCQQNFIEWGADLDFYVEGIKRQKLPPSLDYIVSSGFANRDYDLLTEVFSSMGDIKLKIFDPFYKVTQGASKNIFIDKTINRNTGDRRIDYYYNSLAVAIPIKVDMEWANGGTIMFEAMAMSKPLIMTAAKANLVDIEKEKIGITVGFGDKEGWIQAIQYLKSHPAEAKEMGERGFALAQKKFNYNLFCKQVLENVSNFNLVRK